MYNQEPGLSQMVAVMYEMQEKLNIEASGPHWRRRAESGELRFRLAMKMEAAELIDHMHWKWWKAPKPYDVLKCKLEIVDIWHFFLSDTMAADFDVSIMIEDILSFVPYEDAVDHVAVASNIFAINASWPLFQLTYMFFDSFKDLYVQYIGKNTLNEFRYANGYKEGTYFKMWGAVEDNDVMQQKLATIIRQNTPYPLVAEVLRGKLEAEYAEVVRTGNEQLFT